MIRSSIPESSAFTRAAMNNSRQVNRHCRQRLFEAFIVLGFWFRDYSERVIMFWLRVHFRFSARPISSAIFSGESSENETVSTCFPSSGELCRCISVWRRLMACRMWSNCSSLKRIFCMYRVNCSEFSVTVNCHSSPNKVAASPALTCISWPFCFWVTLPHLSELLIRMESCHCFSHERRYLSPRSVLFRFRWRKDVHDCPLCQKRAFPFKLTSLLFLEKCLGYSSEVCSDR